MRIDKPELRVQSVRFFCPEAWRLQYGLGLEPGNRAALDAGDQHHEQKAVAERIAGGSICIGRLVAVLAVLVLLLLLWWWSMSGMPMDRRCRRCWPCCSAWC